MNIMRFPVIKPVDFLHRQGLWFKFRMLSSPPRPNHARFHPRPTAVIPFLNLTASSQFSSKSSRCLHSSFRLLGASLLVVCLRSSALISLFSFSSVSQRRESNQRKTNQIKVPLQFQLKLLFPIMKKRKQIWATTTTITTMAPELYRIFLCLNSILNNLA
ncbi:hypothetical protein GBA52_026681 [Prunus armeniaca]|nr:hypothetical protein GBA52_026681 [Prunus armeniaca]